MSSIRILHLEDSPLDGELIRTWLERGEVPFTLERVDSREAFLNALECGKYDLILADYALPSFDGLSALEIVTQKCPDLPFLFVSGVLGEEVAINTLQRGATDYVLKQRLDRLVPAVLRALAEARERVERKQAEQALRRSEQQLRQLADAMPQIVWTARPDGTVDYFNRRWYDLTGFPTDTPDSWRWQDILHPDDVERCQATWQQAVQQGEPYQCELRMRQGQGNSYRWHLARALPVRDEVGAIIRWIGTWTNIDDQKQAQEALREADRRKDEFLAMLAHELRNPLAPLLNSLQILRLAGNNPQVVERMRALMERQVHHLRNLIDELLDMSRINRGKIELSRERLDLAGLVGTTAEDRRSVLEQAGLKLAVQVSSAPIWVHGDATRLAQVVTNLLDNAVKFSERGGTVTVGVRTEGDRGVFSIRDQGIGIDQSMLPRIFDVFAQADSSLHRSRGGLGLGLAVVRGLVQLHGGSVEALSEGPGKGAEIVVRLPQDKGPAPTPAGASAPAPVQHKQRVLIVEDLSDAAQSLRLLLELQGHEVAIASTGREGVRTALQWRPDVVLCDLGLPELDGFGVARELRSKPATARSLLVAISGYGQEEDRRSALQAGFDYHLTKPVAPDVLQTILAHPRPRGTRQS